MLQCFLKILPQEIKKGNSIFLLFRIDQQVFLMHDVQALPLCLKMINFEEILHLNMEFQ